MTGINTNLYNLVLKDLRGLSPSELLRANSVERFAMTPMTRTQTVAAHHSDVALIFVWLTSCIGPRDMSLDKDWVMGGLLYSLTHDMAEIFTGDIPAPGKVAYNLQINPKLPEWLKRMLRGYHNEVASQSSDSLLLHVCKCADLISTLFWAIKYGNNGDPYTARMINQLHTETPKYLNFTARLGAQLGFTFNEEWYSSWKKFLRADEVRSVYGLLGEDE